MGFGAASGLARGFTRTAAAESLGWTEFDYVVKSGSLRDAILFSLGENADLGLRRTNEDKRRAVLTMLLDEEWGRQSNAFIAQYCHVSHTFVNIVRRSLETVSGQGKQEKKTRIGADGREYRVDRIQKAARKRTARKSSAPAPEPVDTEQDRPAQPRGLYRPAGAPQPAPSVPAADADPVPTEQDEKHWIADQLRRLAGMVEEYGEAAQARVLRTVANVLARIWKVKK